MEHSEIFLVAVPGLEAPLLAEARELGFAEPRAVAGGVVCVGALAEAVRANVLLRCAVRVLLRVAEFRAVHLAQLDKRARRVDWRAWLRSDVPVRVEAVCRRSRIYVNKAAVQRVAGALEAVGIPVSAEGAVTVKVRIEDDLCTVSLDTTGAALHQRGHKAYVGKAPLRETMAAGFLRMMGFDGRQVVLDPMCGSGTIPLEAAEIAAGLRPGRSRRFAFEQLAAGGEGRAVEALERERVDAVAEPIPRYLGFDRDDGAIRGASGNAERAGVAHLTAFKRQAISDLEVPVGGGGVPGLVLVNPPYGARIGDRKLLFGLYGALGRVMSERFGGWHLGVITSDGGLARATGLDLQPSAPVDHSGLKIRLYQGHIG